MFRLSSVRCHVEESDLGFGDRRVSRTCRILKEFFRLDGNKDDTAQSQAHSQFGRGQCLRVKQLLKRRCVNRRTLQSKRQADRSDELWISSVNTLPGSVFPGSESDIREPATSRTVTVIRF